jgi:hypothetical protein
MDRRGKSGVGSRFLLNDHNFLAVGPMGRLATGNYLLIAVEVGAQAKRKAAVINVERKIPQARRFPGSHRAKANHIRSMDMPNGCARLFYARVVLFISMDTPASIIKSSAVHACP